MPLQISHINTSSNGGGAATVARLLAYAQISSNHVAKIIAKTIDDNDEVGISFPSEAPELLNEEYTNLGLLDYAFQGSHRLIHNSFIKESDVINFHNLHGEYFNPFSTYLLSNFKPTVWTLHDMQAITGHCAHSMECKRYVTGCDTCPSLGTYPGLRNDSTKLLLKHKNEIYKHSILDIVVPSNWLAKRVKASVLSEHPIHTIYNGICTDTFNNYDQTECRKEFNLPENAILIGSTSHFGVIDNPWKGGEHIVNAMNSIWREHPDVYFVNIGANRESEHPRIINIPHISDRKNVAKALSSLDIFIYCSNADNCPLVILEAMACKLPIVSTKTGGIPELIDDGKSGFLAPYKDSDTVAKMIIELINDKELRFQIGENARAHAVKDFDVNLMHEKYLKIYENSINAFQSRKSINNKTLTIPEHINTLPFKEAIDHSLKEKREKEKEIAFSLYMESKFDVSEQKIFELVKEDPSDHEAVTLLGLIYTQKGQTDLAKEIFVNALKLNQYNETAFEELVKITGRQ